MKPTLQLILLIITVSVLLVLYALLPAKPLFAGDFGFRQLPLRRMLTEAPEWEHALTEGEEYEDTTATEEVDTTKQRILLFGDSMVGMLCYPMSRYAAQNGHTLECVAWASTTTRNWAKGDKIRELLNDFHPTHVFICLGSNELYSKDLDGMESRVREILNAIGDIPVIWIGPPNWCQDGGINRVLAQVMGRRAYFPSKDLSLERMPDGHHPTNAGSAKWMNAIAKWIRDGRSIHPILMNTPVRGIKGRMKYIEVPPENGVKRGSGKPLEEDVLKEDEMPAEEFAAPVPESGRKTPTTEIPVTESE